jgi:hypothetical protein
MHREGGMKMEAPTIISGPDMAAHFPDRRSGSRTSMSIEIVLRGVDRWGKAFVEKTRTINLSRTGAKAITGHAVGPGSRLRVVIPHLERTSWGTVAWVGDKTGNQQEIGIAIDETSDFWGVEMEDNPEMSQSMETAPAEPVELNEKMETPMMSPPPVTVQPSVSAEPRKEAAEPVPTREAELENFNKLSNALQKLAQRAIEQSLQDALQQLNRQTAEIMRDMQEVITQHTQDRVRQSVETALQKVEAAGHDAIQRSQSVWQQRIQAVTDSCQLHLGQNKKNGSLQQPIIKK